MVERRRPKGWAPPKAPKKPVALRKARRGLNKERHLIPFKEGHAKQGGRQKGTPNKVSKTMKEAIEEAMTLYGSDAKGKDGLIGYFFSMCADKALMCRLVEKIMPLQITGKNDGPIVLSAPPPELLGRLTPEQLTLLLAIYQQIGSGKDPALNMVPVDGDPNAFAAVIGDSGVEAAPSMG